MISLNMCKFVRRACFLKSQLVRVKGVLSDVHFILSDGTGQFQLNRKVMQSIVKTCERDDAISSQGHRDLHKAIKKKKA